MREAEIFKYLNKEEKKKVQNIELVKKYRVGQKFLPIYFSFSSMKNITSKDKKKLIFLKNYGFIFVGNEFLVFRPLYNCVFF